MTARLTRIKYSDLNSRQKENFNFQKVSAVLADYGYVTLRLSDDWQGADFIAQHIDGRTFLRVQLKSRPAFAKKYLGKDLFIAFHDGTSWFLYPHDEVLQKLLAASEIGKTISWSERGGYSWRAAPRVLRTLLEPYRLGTS
jgi:hypothetical protein